MRRISLFLASSSLVLLSCGHNSGESRGFNAPANTYADDGSTSGDEMLQTTAANANGGGEAGSHAIQTGYASWYGKALAGHKTASGERFDPSAMTAAHRKLKLGTWVEVRRVDTGSTVRVRINDRGPWGDDKRIIDLSRAAADKLGIVRDGLAKVELRIVNGPD
ncbi:MAG TPA: septal ring lytic transglycosylase RlpA family protein [Polyangiaceae bacterium]